MAYEWGWERRLKTPRHHWHFGVRSLPEQVLGEHFFAVEVEVASESATLDDAGEPVDVVGPHFVVGDAV